MVERRGSGGSSESQGDDEDEGELGILQKMEESREEAPEPESADSGGDDNAQASDE